MAEPAGFSTIRYEALGAVARLTFDRSKRANALDGAMLDEIGRALDVAEEDEAVRALIVTGAGPAFSSGFDLKEQMERRPSGVAEWRPLLRKDFDTVMRFWRFPKPTIAAVRGACLAGACELALACDLRIASETASFGQPEINLGIIPGGGGTQRLTRLVGEGKAMEIILAGDMIDAPTALNLGLVNHVFSPEELETKTFELANKIAEKSPIALQMAKEAVKLASRSNLDEGLRREVDLFAICFSTEDKEEGVAAFLEKRKPVFKGR